MLLLSTTRCRGHLSQVNTPVCLFVASEYCPDGTYRDVLSQYAANTTTFDGIVDDMRQVVHGLRVLHGKMIHRDLKPENVFISGDKLKIGDFGLSKFVDQATRSLTFKGSGTPRYMAPEVWLNQHATAATDLYAVGVMLYEALTGQPPFSAPDVNVLRESHLYWPIPRAKSINVAVPEYLDGIVKRLLAKEPNDRYQTADELLEALGYDPPPSSSDVAARIFNLMFDIPTFQRPSASLFIGARAR